MNRTLWIHEFSQWQPFYGSEPIAPIIAQQGFTRVAVKAMDGATWMSAFDTSTDAISGVQSLKDWLASFNRHGLAMDVWVVPTKDTWRQAIDDYNSIANTLPGRFILDLEPYAQFWGDLSNPDEMIDHLSARTHLWATIDPRRDGWDDDFIGRCQGIMPQVYDVAWLKDIKPTGIVAEVVLSTSQRAQDWWTICRDPVAWSEDGRTGFGIFRGPVLGAEYGGTLRGLT
jgi:hypothetical protein